MGKQSLQKTSKCQCPGAELLAAFAVSLGAGANITPVQAKSVKTHLIDCSRCRSAVGNVRQQVR